jgi:tripartite-type tricarboxylate transporter receptor subunit TctC
MKRLSIVLVLLLLACSLVTAQAQQETASYPTKPIDFVIASSAGSGGDVLTRLIAKYMSEELGVGINVLNQGGGNGIPAVQSVLNAKPDGYTFLADQALSSSYQMLLSDLPFVVEERNFIVRFAKGPQVLCVNPNRGWKDLNDVVKFAKENPGELIWAGISASSAADLVQLQFMRAAGINVKQTKKLAFTGGGEILSAIAGGHAMLGTSAASGVPSFAQSGKVLPIAVAGSSRIASLPDVKSAAEQGFPEVTIGFWIGLSGRPDLPQNVVDTILAAARKVKENENFLADLGKLGLVLDYAETTQMKNDILDESKSVKELQLFGQGM